MKRWPKLLIEVLRSKLSMLHLNEKDFTDDLLCASLRFQKRTSSIGYDGHMNMSTGVWSSGIKFYGQIKYGLPLTDIQELGSLGV